MFSATAGRVASITGRDRSESTWSPCQSMYPPAGCGHSPLVVRYPFYSIAGQRILAGRVAGHSCRPIEAVERASHGVEEVPRTELSMPVGRACRRDVGPIRGPGPGGNEMAQY